MNIGVKTGLYKDGEQVDYYQQVSQEGSDGEFSKDFIYTNDDGELVQLQYTTLWRQVKLTQPANKEG